MSQHRITWPSTTLRVGFGVSASAYSKSGHFGFWWPVLRQTLQQIFLFFATGGLGGAPSPSTAGAGLFLVPWFDDAAAEKSIKDETKATIRCFPLGEQHRAEGRVCFYSGKPATHMALFGRAF